jgi:hypothetical protein
MCIKQQVLKKPKIAWIESASKKIKLKALTLKTHTIFFHEDLE